MQEDGKWITTKSGNRVFIKNKDINDYMNSRIRSSTKEQSNEINNKYKDKLLYPIEKYKVKNYWTGDEKTGKYHNEYHAKTKNGYDIYAKTLEELEQELKKDIYK